MLKSALKSTTFKNSSLKNTLTKIKDKYSSSRSAVTNLKN
jgi:hypothetical protein